MADIIEQILNLLGAVIVGAVFIEWGVSRWNHRPFTKKNLWAILLVVFGVRIALKGIL